jgi:hypothetical protein
VAEDVVKKLRLDRDPEFNPKAKRAGAALPEPRALSKIAERLQAHTESGAPA